MPHVLHLLKDPANLLALDAIAEQATDPGMRLSLVLLPEARDLAAALPGEVYHLAAGGSAPGSPHRTISHEDLLDLIFAADTVITW